MARLPGCVAAIVLGSPLLLAADAPKKQPNIVLIVSDDQGYRDLGCFGSERIKTPNLDRLAKEGVRATSFYVTWPACTPSRGSLLTGRYPQRNGLYDMIRNDLVNYGHRYTEEEYALSPEMTLGLDVREVTIAQVLKRAGYATGVVGKWDSGRARRFLPLQRGFDFFYGFANTGIDYWTHERYGIPSMFRGNERIKEEGYATELFRREALDFIEKNKDRPFFLYVPFNAPHGASNLEKDPYQVPEKYLKQYSEDATANRTKYMAMVTCMDEAIGEIMARLRTLGLEKDTLVLFFADNGGTKVGDNGPLRGFKGQMFEGGLRVPFLARWPGQLPAGRVSDDFLTSLEVFPTLARVAGAEPPKDVILDGFEMLPVLQGMQVSPRKEVFWQRRSDRAARVGQYKWVESASGSGLFDLSSDLGEQRDLRRDRPDVLKQVQNRWSAWRGTMDAAEPRGPFRDY
jgi:arylsulfatase A-like enzyme